MDTKQSDLHPTSPTLLHSDQNHVNKSSQDDDTTDQEDSNCDINMYSPDSILQISQ